MPVTAVGEPFIEGGPARPSASTAAYPGKRESRKVGIIGTAGGLLQQPRPSGPRRDRRFYLWSQGQTLNINFHFLRRLAVNSTSRESRTGAIVYFPCRTLRCVVLTAAELILP